MLVFYLLAVLEQKKRKGKKEKRKHGASGDRRGRRKKRGLGLPESRGVALFCLVVVFGSLSHPGLSLTLSLLSLSLSRHSCFSLAASGLGA
jgi:hypothetical protein